MAPFSAHNSHEDSDDTPRAPVAFDLGDPETPDSETTTLEHFPSNDSSTLDHEDETMGIDHLSPSSSASSSSSSSRASSTKRDVLDRSSSSFQFFAPPHYGRPPTPLPPSPSMLSIFRSATASRASTPDSSDVETQGDTESAVTKSARISIVPRASPKVPTYEYYGFVLYLASSFSFLMYLLWSYLPAPFLHQLGIYYYPNRWWSLAIPSFLVMTIVYIYIALASYNTGYLTLPMQSIENMVDEAAQIAILDREGRVVKKHKQVQGQGQGQGRAMYNGGPNRIDWKTVWSEGTDAVMDVPLGGVCEVLYGGG